MYIIQNILLNTQSIPSIYSRLISIPVRFSKLDLLGCCSG